MRIMVAVDVLIDHTQKAGTYKVGLCPEAYLYRSCQVPVAADSLPREATSSARVNFLLCAHSSLLTLERRAYWLTQ